MFGGPSALVPWEDTPARPWGGVWLGHGVGGIRVGRRASDGERPESESSHWYSGWKERVLEEGLGQEDSGDPLWRKLGSRDDAGSRSDGVLSRSPRFPE